MIIGRFNKICGRDLKIRRQNSARFWTAAALCRFGMRLGFQERQRAAAVQDANARFGHIPPADDYRIFKTALKSGENPFDLLGGNVG